MINANLVKELRELTGAGILDCKKALEATNGDIKEATTWLREKGISKAAKKESRIAAEGLTEIVICDNEAVIIEVNSETDFVAKNVEFQDLVKNIANAILNSSVKTVDEVLALNVNGETINDMIVSKIAKIGEKLSFRRFEKIKKSDDEQFGSYIHMGGKIAVLVLLDNKNAEVAKDIAMHVAAMKPLYIDRNQVPSEVLEQERNILKEQAVNEGKPVDIAEKMIEGRIRKYYEDVCLVDQFFIKNGDITVGTYAKNNDCIIKNMIRYEVGEGIEKRCEDFATEVAKQINS